MSISPLAGEFTIVDKTLTLPRHPMLKYHPRDVAVLRWIAVHHTAGKDNPQTPEIEPELMTVEQIARYHVETNGWSGIGYHFCVRFDGLIYKVRPIGVIGACVKANNTPTVCIAFIGNYSERRPSREMLEAGAWLARKLRNVYPWIVGVKGHREFMGTECPGTKFPLAEFKALVETGIT